MRPGELSSLVRGIDNAFQVYAKHVADSLGIPLLGDVMPNGFLSINYQFRLIYCE